MNLCVVSQGSLSTQVVEPDLVGDIKTIHHYDSQIEQIKCDLREGRPSFFTGGDDGAFFFKGRPVVPNRVENLDITLKVMTVAHDTPLSIHPGSTKMCQDIRRRF